MAEAIRTIRTVVQTALAVDRRATGLVLLLAAVAWLGNALQAMGVGLMVYAFTVNDPLVPILAVAANGVMYGGINYTFNLRQAIRITLQEKTTHELDRRLHELIGSIPGIEHLERPEYLDRLSTLRTQSLWFGNVGAVIELPAVFLNVVVTVALLFAIDPVLALVPLAGIPAFWLSGRGEGAIRAAEETGAPNRRLRRRMLELATDPDAAAEARLFEVGPEELARFDAATAAYERDLLRAGLVGAVASIAGWAIFSAALAFSFIVVSGGVRDGRLPLAALFAMVFLVRLSSFHAEVTLGVITGLRRTVTATRNYLWLVDHAATRVQPAGAPGLPAAGELRFERVSFRYPDAARDALSDVDLAVPAGSTLALVGDNGAGKTTLVKLLARFYEPTAGRITLNGVDIASLDIAAWRGGLTACLQDFSRFEFLVRETVGAGDLAALDDLPRISAAVGSAGADDVIASLPDGLETQLGTSWDGGAELSTGQWQKLALGRSMMRGGALLLLLDEPTAALDAAAEARLFERYTAASAFAHASGSITIIVSHRMSTVRMADRIAVVEAGRITQFGTHDDLVAADGAYRELYRTQASAYAG